jgi:hypothetical protein
VHADDASDPGPARVATDPELRIPAGASRVAAAANNWKGSLMLTNHGRRFPAISALACVAALAAPAAASAHGDGNGIGAHDYAFSVSAVPHDPAADNGSDVSGSSEFKLRGRQLTVSIVATGLDALPHAMHIHGKDAGELAFCPGAERRDDLVDDGLIETLEGLSDYGGIQTSLTTSGDTSPGSALALDRFASANVFGTLRYERRIKVSSAVARNLADKHVVIHGEDLDNDGVYGGRTTALGAPLEAELPVACGEVTS